MRQFALDTWRWIVLVLGAVMLLGVVVTNVPGNPWVTWTRHRVIGQIVAHTAVALVVIALIPSLMAALPAARVSRRRFLTGLGVVVLGLAAVMVGLVLAAPATMDNLLTREWGVLEPLQFAAYGVGALICRAAARTVGPGHPRQPLYRAGVLVLVVMMIEEVDYLGLGAPLLSLFGVTRGRIDGVYYLGSFHDLFNLAVRYSVVALLPLLVLLLLALPWLRRQAAPLVAEARSWTSLPLAPAALLIALAQADDILGFGGLPFGTGTRVSVEEPLEFLGIVCLNASLIAKLGRETGPRPGKASSAAAEEARRPGRRTAPPAAVHASTIVREKTGPEGSGHEHSLWSWRG